MRKVDIPKFRKEIVSIIETNQNQLTSFKHEDDYSVITFCGKDYVCEITLNDKWIGYDLDITTPKETVACGLADDTDIYPIYGGRYEEVALEIYDDLVDTVLSIFEHRMYYYADEKHSYTIRLNKDGSYKVRFWEAKKFLFWKYTSGWRDDEHVYSKMDIDRLKLKVLN